MTRNVRSVVTGAGGYLPDEVVTFARKTFAPMSAEMYRSPNVFGTEIAVSDESVSDAFLAWTGRDPHWRA